MPNPVQVRTLLASVGERRVGRRMVAFYACLYFAALRPEEASKLTRHDLVLPGKGWGEIHLCGAASLLARTPYDLRHAAVSAWLNAGIPPRQVADWAGQSFEVLLRIYAKCLDGGLTLLQQRIDASLGYGSEG